MLRLRNTVILVETFEKYSFLHSSVAGLEPQEAISFYYTVGQDSEYFCINN
jgi:hypothetical protein